MENLIRNMLTPNPHFRITIGEMIDILENWNLVEEVKLNEVAKVIKQNEDYIDSGEYEKATRN